jgi:hypothetical protein
MIAVPKETAGHRTSNKFWHGTRPPAAERGPDRPGDQRRRPKAALDQRKENHHDREPKVALPSSDSLRASLPRGEAGLMLAELSGVSDTFRAFTCKPRNHAPRVPARAIGIVNCAKSRLDPQPAAYGLRESARGGHLRYASSSSKSPPITSRRIASVGVPEEQAVRMLSLWRVTPPPTCVR